MSSRSTFDMILWISILFFITLEKTEAENSIKDFEFWQGLMFRANLAKEDSGRETADLTSSKV